VEPVRNSISSVLDEIVDSLVICGTAAEFQAAREAAFPKYLLAMRAFGDLFQVLLPKLDMERVLTESLAGIEADFTKHGTLAFGPELSQQAVFTIWILRKLKDLSHELEGLPKYPETLEIVDKCAASAIWTRLHIDCLLRAMHANVSITAEVRPLLEDGLKSGVEAYAWLRQAVDRSAGTEEPELAPIPWDEEDEDLLADSMRDLKSA